MPEHYMINLDLSLLTLILIFINSISCHYIKSINKRVTVHNKVNISDHGPFDLGPARHFDGFDLHEM